MSIYAVAVGVAYIRRDPDPASELVTQALMNVPANAGETLRRVDAHRAVGLRGMDS